MGRRSLLVVTGWLAAAGLAMLIGLGAIRLVGESITGTPGGVHSQAEVERALAASPVPVPGGSGGPGGSTPGSGTPSAGGGTPTAPPTVGGTAMPAFRKGFSGPGGNAVAECTAAGVSLLSWSPAQGYRVTDVDRGPDDDVEVTFEGPGGEFEIKIQCRGGQPVADPDDD